MMKNKVRQVLKSYKQSSIYTAGQSLTIFVCYVTQFKVNIESAINIWSRYLDFVEKHGEILAEIAGVETGPFVDMCYRKALNATQYHIPEVILTSCKCAD